MIFEELPLEGAFVVAMEPIEDQRGFNARAWCEREFEAAGLTAVMKQVNVVQNHRRGTLRGMHYQRPPMAETKLVRVTAGSLCDVIVDLRPDSATYGRWHAVTLSASEPKMLHIPDGCAHGLQTLEDGTQFTYQVSQFFSPEHAAGFRYDDPRFSIEWPLEVTSISAKDEAWPPFEEVR
jgi:dTDP-4-dehydrorhamnose 3,5-epimerase